MSEDSDEDVVFSNSPLVQHLTDVGIDIQCEDIKPPSIVTKSTDSFVQPSACTLTVVKRLFYVMYCTLRVIVGISALKEEIDSMENEYKEKLLLSAFKSKALELEDQQFLENFTERFGKKKSSLTKPFKMSKLLVMVALPCVLAYGFSRVMYPDQEWQYTTVTDLSAICTLLYFLIYLINHCILSYQRLKIDTVHLVILNCFQIGEKMVKYSQKSIRLIQESELVSRGFTLVSQHSPISRLEQNSLHHTQRQCPQLRSTLFHCSRNCFYVMKSSTTSIITRYPLDASIDSVMNYLCFISMEDFGQCLQIRDDAEDSTKHLHILTDGFSVASLKGVKHLYHLQQSEFLRRLTLTFLESDISTLCRNSEVINLVDNVSKTLLSNIEKLKRSFDIHSCCTVNPQAQSVRMSSHTSSPISDVYVAVHSLDLHLQAAILRIRSLSTIMEHQIEKTENATEETDQSKDRLLQQVKQELLACKGCWEEGLCRVEHLMKEDKEPEKSDTVKTEITKPTDAKPIPQCGLEDPVIEDEVFEAYNDEDEEESGDNTWDEFLSPEEKEKKRKEKEEALRLLTELKSVISVRAQDTAKREQIALGKAKGGKDTHEHTPQNEADVEQGDLNPDSSTNVICSENKSIKNNERRQQNDKTVESECNTKQTSKEEQQENIIKPRKHKYVYCPPEDERDTSTGCISGPQFFGLPVLGKQEDVEERLCRLSGANLPFTSLLASQAVAQSQKIGLHVQMFGDDQQDDYFIDDDDSLNEDSKSRDSLDDDSKEDSLQDDDDVSRDHCNDDLKSDSDDSLDENYFPNEGRDLKDEFNDQNTDNKDHNMFNTCTDCDEADNLNCSENDVQKYTFNNGIDQEVNSSEESIDNSDGSNNDFSD